MIPIISLLVVITLSILITRIATIALTHTGLSRESARFQARSAFTGAGFTTSESERVVNHPVRRRIVLFLMMLGNAGIVTSVSTLILTFVGPERSSDLGLKIGLLVGGLLTLWAVATSAWVDRHLSRLIDRMLARMADFDTRDYAGLLRLAGGYQLVELAVREGDWIAGKTLAAAEVWDEGLVVLGILRRDGSYLGAPRGEARVDVKDTLFIYGRGETIEALDSRERGVLGDLEHRVAARAQEAEEAAEAERPAEPAEPSEPRSTPEDDPDDWDERQDMHAGELSGQDPWDREPESEAWSTLAGTRS